LENLSPDLSPARQQTLRAEIQAPHPSGRLHDHTAHRLVHGLGATSSAQSRHQCHLRLDLQDFLPRFAIVDTARH
jgi:hypothetical protein